MSQVKQYGWVNSNYSVRLNVREESPDCVVGELTITTITGSSNNDSSPLFPEPHSVEIMESSAEDVLARATTETQSFCQVGVVAFEEIG